MPSALELFVQDRVIPHALNSYGYAFARARALSHESVGVADGVADGILKWVTI
jgi:hypothetical protein